MLNNLSDYAYDPDQPEFSTLVAVIEQVEIYKDEGIYTEAEYNRTLQKIAYIMTTCKGMNESDWEKIQNMTELGD